MVLLAELIVFTNLTRIDLIMGTQWLKLKPNAKLLLS